MRRTALEVLLGAGALPARDQRPAGRVLGAAPRGAVVAPGAALRDPLDQQLAVADRLAEHAEARRALFANGPAVGTPEQVVETFAALRQAGLGYAICYFADAAYDRTSLELFEREVIPALAD